MHLAKESSLGMYGGDIPMAYHTTEQGYQQLQGRLIHHKNYRLEYLDRIWYNLFA